MKRDGYVLIDALAAAAIFTVGFLAVTESLWISKRVLTRPSDMRCGETMLLSAIVDEKPDFGICGSDTTLVLTRETARGREMGVVRNDESSILLEAVLYPQTRFDAR